MPNNGTPAAIGEAGEALDLLEVEEVEGAPDERTRPRKAVIIPDLTTPRPARREEIGIWTDASSGNRKRENKVDTAIP